MMYRGSKDQIQNSGADSPTSSLTGRRIYRVGAFGNYLFFDKLDLLGGYIHSQDDWQWTQGGPMSHYTATTIRGEADYYIKTGTVIMARFDRATANHRSQPTMHTQAWGIGARTRTDTTGNVVLRAAYHPGARWRSGRAGGHNRQTVQTRYPVHVVRRDDKCTKQFASSPSPASWRPCSWRRRAAT